MLYCALRKKYLTSTIRRVASRFGILEIFWHIGIGDFKYLKNACFRKCSKHIKDFLGKNLSFLSFLFQNISRISLRIMSSAVCFFQIKYTKMKNELFGIFDHDNSTIVYFFDKFILESSFTLFWKISTFFLQSINMYLDKYI